MQFSISCSGYGNYHDDISATMQLFQDQHLKRDNIAQAPEFINPFLNDVHRVLQLNLDFSGDVKTENYLKNGLHQRTLSMQLSLGYWGGQSHRSLSSKVAFAILQLRWAALTLAMSLKPNPSGAAFSGEAELKRTGIQRISTLYGCILTSSRNNPLLFWYHVLDFVDDEFCCRRIVHSCYIYRGRFSSDRHGPNCRGCNS